MSGFSQSGEEVSILAPSDYWITSAGKKGGYEQFGGTSGAAPLVTGSLAGFEWLSGYHPTAKEAKILLEKTALPTLHSFEKPRLNGAGLLNAYKLGEVAKRLKEKCKDKSIVCFQEEILKDENYRFSKDKSLKRDLARVFPSCLGDTGFRFIGDCEEKKEVFKRLRKEVLLNPSKRLLKSLSCIYKEEGLTGNAEALEKLAMALGTERELRAKLRASLSKKEDVSDDELRLMLGMGAFVEELNPSEWKRGLEIASGIGEKALPLLEKGFASGNRKLQEVALSSAGNIGEKALLLLEKGFASGNRKLQEVALSSAGNIGEKALPLLEKGFASGNRKLQEAALSSAVNIGEKALPLLEKGFASGNRKLQEAALSSAVNIGEKALPLLEKGFASGNRKLQEVALSSAVFVGEKALPLLEKGFASGNRKLQEVALSSAVFVGEKALPLLEKGFASGDPRLQQMVLSSAINIGEKALPLLEKGFASDDRRLQQVALSSAGFVGEKALPLLEKGFASDDRRLQQVALSSAGFVGEKALPLLKKMLRTKNLDKEFRKKIKDQIVDIEKYHL